MSKFDLILVYFPSIPFHCATPNLPIVDFWEIRFVGLLPQFVVCIFKYGAMIAFIAPRISMDKEGQTVDNSERSGSIRGIEIWPCNCLNLQELHKGPPFRTPRQFLRSVTPSFSWRCKFCRADCGSEDRRFESGFSPHIISARQDSETVVYRPFSTVFMLCVGDFFVWVKRCMNNPG